MVNKKIEIIWDDEAKRSLRNIYYYIKDNQSIEVAKKLRYIPNANSGAPAAYLNYKFSNAKGWDYELFEEQESTRKSRPIIPY